MSQQGASAKEGLPAGGVQAPERKVQHPKENIKASDEKARMADENGDDTVSIATSVSSALGSATRLQEVKIKLELAKAKREQLKRVNELKQQEWSVQRKLANLEIDNEIENAQIEASLLLEQVDQQVSGVGLPNTDLKVNVCGNNSLVGNDTSLNDNHDNVPISHVGKDISLNDNHDSVPISHVGKDILSNDNVHDNVPKVKESQLSDANVNDLTSSPSQQLSHSWTQQLPQYHTAQTYGISNAPLSEPPYGNHPWIWQTPQPQVRPTYQLDPHVPPYIPQHFVNASNHASLPRGHGHGSDMDGLAQIVQAINLAVNLPKPDLAFFDGTPVEYRSFINAFEVNIEAKVGDDRTRLTYLIQYCKGKARSSIENCVLMEATQGYVEAKRILQEQFGQPHIVASAHIGKVIKRHQLKPNDSAGLWDLARDMQRCQMVLAQMGYMADLNSSQTLLSTQRLLPLHLQSEWAKRAHSMMIRGVVPNFEMMTRFVEEAAQLACNIFGMNIGNTSRADGAKPKPGSRKFSFSTHANVDQGKKCPCCQGTHRLRMCGAFKLKSVDERRDFARRTKLCFNCLGHLHFAAGCLSKPQCDVTGCGRRHDPLLHSDDWEKKNSDTRKRSKGKNDGIRKPKDVAEPAVSIPQAQSSKDRDQSAQAFSANISRGKVRLRVIPVTVQGNGRWLQTWALLDQGSDVSLCTQTLVNELGLAGIKTTFQLTTVDQPGSHKQGMEVSLSVKGVHEDEVLKLPHVWTINTLPVSTECFPEQGDLKEWPHLDGVILHAIDETEVHLLIGGDTPEAFWMLEQRVGNPKEPYAIRTPLGWTLLGPTSSKRRYPSASINFARLDRDPLQAQLEQFWELDFGGYLQEEKAGKSIEDQRALKMMENTSRKVGNHHEVGLPWRCWPPELPFNRYLAEVRLRYLKSKLKKDDVLREKYSTTISEYISNGYAEEVPKTSGHGLTSLDVAEQTFKDPIEAKWYLPHHAVVHPHKPEKVRVVFDCAARYRGTALNDQLLQGPDLTNNLTGVLTRFRQERIAFVADVQGMFHQVKVPVQDRDAMRFLWWKNSDLTREPTEYRMTVHLFGATSSPSCAGFALRKTAKDAHGQFNKEVIDTVLNNFYVDDCLKSMKSKEDAKCLAKDLRCLLAQGGFRLTKWLCNDLDVLASIPETERADSVLNLDLEDLPVQRTLGILWDMKADSFGFKVHVRETPFTRRGILSVASSLYDPLGFVAPFVLHAKVLLQRLCRRKLGWDDPISEEEKQEWKRWIQDLPILTDLEIERCFKPDGFREVETATLHHFCDASETSYATVSYLRLTDKTGRIHCAFVLGKSRLAPLKVVSIPRLELMAAVLAVTVDQFLKAELGIQVDDITFWTDSTSVLHYIRSESKRFKTFVANRIAKIHGASTPSQWRHVDTKSNPADDGSRGLRASEMIAKRRWLSGPEFLWKEYGWPVMPDAVEPSIDDPEVKKTVPVYATMMRAGVGDLLKRYSSWNKLKRSAAWLLRYKKVLQAKANGEVPDSLKEIVLSSIELEEAERSVIRFVQRDEFKDVLDGKMAQNVPMSKLNPIVVDGIVRVGGRLQNSQMDDETKHPIVLPSHHHVTRLLIEHHHHLVGHSGAGMTWTSVRRKYWVLKGGATVRRVIGKCFLCKRRNAKRMNQFMAELPASRVTPDKPPFAYTGVDYFGPFTVKQGRSAIKRYGCLFTCLNSRAVHLEISNTLETDSFINALRRFIARRGKPVKIYSDNGTNFKGADRELRENLASLDQRRVVGYLGDQEIGWEFNPPGASHMGGVWERMVRSVKKILTSLLGQQVVCDEVLSTFMIEVEAILNARPLTQLSLDPNDDEPLTPNHLLLLKGCPSLPPGVFHKNDNYGRRRWRQVQYLASVFWRRWKTEYLPLLQERQKWLSPRRNLAVNDLVLVADESAPRGKWPLGKVVEVYPGKDGFVRQAEVKVGSRFFKRPISKLCMLEAVGDK